MRRLFVFALLLIASFDAAGQTRKEGQIFGPRYYECRISDFHLLKKSLNGQKDAVSVKVPGILKSRMKKEIVKMAAKDGELSQVQVRKMVDGLEDIYYVSFEKCNAAFRDSLNRAIRAKIQPLPQDWCKDSCYVFGYRKSASSDTIQCLLMHVESQNAIIYLTGKFPYPIH